MRRGVNFDNFGNALLALFNLASADNWTDLMWDGVASTGRATGFVEYNNEALCLYFLVFMVVGSFFIVNIFVGVFVDAYKLTAAFVSGARRFGARERGLQRVNTMRFNLNMTSALKENPVRAALFALTSDPKFDVFIAVAIVGNVAAMVFETNKSAAWQLHFLALTNVFFALLFGAEAAAKLLALHPARYFANNWNRFDFSVALISFAGIALDNSGISPLFFNPTLLRTLRVARIARILRAFRLLRAAKGLHTLLATLLSSLPQIANLLAMLALVFFASAVLAVELFSNLCARGEAEVAGGGGRGWCRASDPAGALDPHASFVNLGMALLSLFRVTTADNWGELMNAVKVQPGLRAVGALEAAQGALARGDWGGVWGALPGCLTDAEVEALGLCGGGGGFDASCGGTCGQGIVAPLFFALFVGLTNFLMLNLVVAVLMQQLADVEGGAANQLTQLVDTNTLYRIVARWKKNSREKVKFAREGDGARSQAFGAPKRSLFTLSEGGGMGVSERELRPMGGLALPWVSERDMRALAGGGGGGMGGGGVWQFSAGTTRQPSSVNVMSTQ